VYLGWPLAQNPHEPEVVVGVVVRNPDRVQRRQQRAESVLVAAHVSVKLPVRAFARVQEQVRVTERQ